VSPDRRRRVVPHLRRRFGASERRACAVVGQHRSTQRRRRTLVPDAEHLRKKLRALATDHPRWGYRKQHTLLCREGWSINRKRVRRIWREEGLQVRRRKRRRRKASKTPGHLAASQPNNTWAMDYQFDETAGGRRLKILNVTDEFTREALASEVGRSIDAKTTVKVLAELVGTRGAPRYVRCDNGPEFVSDALKRWCVGSGATTSFIDPGAPWQNAFVESFNGRMREELLNLEVFDSLYEAKVLIEDWRVEYNDYRPHRSLRMLTPSEFAARWKEENEPRLS
jgi:putative transposase